MKKRLSVARIGVAYPRYVQIALGEFLAFSRAESEIKAAENNPASREQIDRDIEVQLEEAYLKTIIFSALAVEAFIYDVAATVLTDKFVRAHLDKLSVIDKYVVVPMLIGNVDVDKSREWFHLLSKLIHQRNELVHSKSKDFDLARLNSDPLYFAQFTKEKDNISPKDAVKVLFLITEEMQNIWGFDYNVFDLANRETVVSLVGREDIFQKVHDIVFA